jgi:hypothetical protein
LIALSCAATVFLTACGSEKSTGPASGIADPEKAVFVTSDIEHFWKAYDSGGASGATAPFQAEYLDRASPGSRISLRRAT